MKLHKGKWKANFRDTFSLQHTLSPIIGAALVKFKEVITEEGGYRKGLPVTWQEEKVEEGLVEWEDEVNWVMSDESFNKCFDAWLEMLDECIYAFTVKDPDIMKYNFTYISGEHDGEEGEFGTIRWDKVCTDEEEKERYNKDMVVHRERVQKGYELFGKYLATMWW